MKLKLLLLSVILLSCKNDKQPEAQQTAKEIPQMSYTEKYRPQLHFTPQAHWMNDPNGLVYNNGVYHLFYQYYPEDIVWGPMHWGHAVSDNMIHWEHKPVALFPDEHGYIFSGSAVVDVNNTSGFGKDSIPPLVAIFTYHDAEKEKAGENNYQTQGIAFSLDNGDTWTKYKGNPVLPNTALKDFRDPKVFWDEAHDKWVMLLVAGDRLMIYHSDDLKQWEYKSEFGANKGAHGGVWECPDLFKLTVDGEEEEKWVLLISINPGGPNGGSATQYFVGDFDGSQFTSSQENVKWIDHGADNYAGVTYNNTPENKRLCIGWMSNWNYAQKTPTETWRSAMTLPRELSLEKHEGTYYLHSKVIDAFETLYSGEAVTAEVVKPGDTLEMKGAAMFDIRFTSGSEVLEIELSNAVGEKVRMRLDRIAASFEIDRSESGATDFDTGFAATPHGLPLGYLAQEAAFRVITDRSSLEVFIDEGRYVMTEQVFPQEPYDRLIVNEGEVRAISVNPLQTIWKNE